MQYIQRSKLHVVGTTSTEGIAKRKDAALTTVLKERNDVFTLNEAWYYFLSNTFVNPFMDNMSKNSGTL